VDGGTEADGGTSLRLGEGATDPDAAGVRFSRQVNPQDRELLERVADQYGLLPFQAQAPVEQAAPIEQPAPIKQPAPVERPAGRSDLDRSRWESLLVEIRAVLAADAETDLLSRRTLHLVEQSLVLPMDQATVVRYFGAQTWEGIQALEIAACHDSLSKLILLRPDVTDPRLAASWLRHETGHNAQDARGLPRLGKSSELRRELDTHADQRDFELRVLGSTKIAQDNTELAADLSFRYGSLAQEELDDIIDQAQKWFRCRPEQLRPFHARTARRLGMPTTVIQQRINESRLRRRWLAVNEELERWSADGFDADAEVVALHADRDHYLAESEASGDLPRGPATLPPDRSVSTQFTDLARWPVRVDYHGAGYESDKLIAMIDTPYGPMRLVGGYNQYHRTLSIQYVDLPRGLTEVDLIDELRAALVEAAHRVTIGFGPVDVVDDPTE